jgi:hypothetical protein
MSHKICKEKFCVMCFHELSKISNENNIKEIPAAKGGPAHESPMKCLWKRLHSLYLVGLGIQTEIRYPERDLLCVSHSSLLNVAPAPLQQGTTTSFSFSPGKTPYETRGVLRKSLSA